MQTHFSSHTTTNNQFTIKILTKIEEVSREDWNKVYPDILEGYAFYKTLDESRMPGFIFYYILIYQGDKLIGSAPCFFTIYRLDMTIQGPFKKLSQALKKIFPGLFSLKAVICGSPACEGRIGIASDNQAEILAAIVKGLEKIAEDNGSSVIGFKDFSPHYTPLLDSLLQKGFFKIPMYPSVEIDLNFNNFEEYLKTLSHSSRKSIRKKFKRAAALPKIEYQVKNDLRQDLEKAQQLYKQVLNNSEVQFEEYTAEFLKSISRNMPNEVKFFLWYIEKKLVAFNLCLVSKDTMVDEYLGLDYSLAYKYGLYFITFRDILTWCIENGIKKYESGAMAYEAKRRLGHRFIPLYAYAKHLNRAINPFLALLGVILQPRNFDPELKDLYRRGLL